MQPQLIRMPISNYLRIEQNPRVSKKSMLTILITSFQTYGHPLRGN